MTGPILVRSTALLYRTARSLGADVIVVSTHGRGGLSPLVLGSVASPRERRGRRLPGPLP
jgi:hypothetical protein